MRVLLALLLLCPGSRAAEDLRIPEALRSWETWALWGDDTRGCPSPWNDSGKTLCLWPSRLSLDVKADGASFELPVSVFRESWLPLPGGNELWPMDVQSDGSPLPVVERDGKPHVKLPPGEHRLSGRFAWRTPPQKIEIPPAVGIVSLTFDGKPVESLSWDASGQLWLQSRPTQEDAARDFLSTKYYGLLEDGIPVWLRGELELIVSGKNREEHLGAVLPAGWKLASLEAPIPVAIDESGRLKAQVRPGRWTVRFSAFLIKDVSELAFAKDVQPVAPEALVAFRSKPDFRMVEVTGSPSVDVSQVAFPEAWRNLPVYRWDTGGPFTFEQRLRGMGLQAPPGLEISREWWLDQDGAGLTFRDRISGANQTLWRLDASEGQELGSVRSNGVGQLVTRSPVNGAPGVEIRQRDFQIDADGRMPRAARIPATGWASDAEALRVSLNLPPGWRLFALFGADWVQGDWLTAWTLLDLFLLLIFTFAVGRLLGWRCGVLAFLAFGMAYHEQGAPRFVWLWLLVPIALLSVVRHEWARRLLLAAKWLVVLVFLLIAVSFASRQIQQAIYPQLERPTSPVFAVPESSSRSAGEPPMSVAAPAADSYASGTFGVAKRQVAQQSAENLQYDTKARIQTGPGVPTWTWRTVQFGWNGPVTAAQKVRPLLIPMGLERVLAVLRVLLIVALAAVLLKGRRPAAIGAACFAILFLPAGQLRAEFPSDAMLETLATRLLEPSDAFPNAAAIPSAKISLSGNRIEMDVEIQAAAACAVPLPGRLPAWSPLSVTLNGKPAPALRRGEGFLWISVPAGVCRVGVTGMLPDVDEWEWTFLLKPKTVQIIAPEWTVNGVSPDSVPGQQVFFSKIQKAGGAEAAYDRQAFSSVAVVERRIELGLVWQIRTTVRRITPPGRAMALAIPLLDGENVLSATDEVADGTMQVRLGAKDLQFTWESEMTPRPEIRLEAKSTDSWVEQWSLVASPIWNVAFSGLAPVFEQGTTELVPVWRPWPGESASLAISRPEAIGGATVTVESSQLTLTPGNRQQSADLVLSLRCSLGEDFPVTLPPDSEVTNVLLNGQNIPARMDAGKLIIPLRPGEQTVQVSWKNSVPLSHKTTGSGVQLPAPSVNASTILNVPDSRWVLWTFGPLQGPAVRFWTVLACSLLAAGLLARVPISPLGTVSWTLLGLGLTQVPLPAALAVVGWLFLIAWRGRPSFQALSPWPFNLLQVAIVLATVLAFAVFVAVVAEGLLGNPEMFIAGNNSTRTVLQWYQARAGELLPQPGFFSVSIWWFRFLMLAWALWLAVSLLRWLRMGWENFSSGGCLRRSAKTPPTPPPL